jgi:hypothetical protein
MTIDEIKTALEDRTLTVVSERTGVHYNTLLRIKMGLTTSPRRDTLAALSAYLRGKAQ